MIYTTKDMRIVPFERHQHMTETYRSWFNDPDVTRYNSHGLFPYSPGAMEAFVRDIENGSASRIIWAIECAVFDSRQPVEPDWYHVGNCSLQAINMLNRSTELAIVLGDRRGKGVGTQACKWILNHAFLKLGLNRVWTGTAATNIGMNKICAGLGMTREGVFKDGTFLDGEFVDIYAYGITRSAWNALR